MLWFIIIWLASGLIVPLLLLLRIAHRRLAPLLARSVVRLSGFHRNYTRAALVFGSVGIGVLVLLLSSLFSASPGTIGEQPSPASVAQEREGPEQTVARNVGAAEDGLLPVSALPSMT